MLNAHDVLRQDEDLLRLLHYPPTYNEKTGVMNPNPLAKTKHKSEHGVTGWLDILRRRTVDGDSEEVNDDSTTKKLLEAPDEHNARVWDVVDKHIFEISKADDMENDSTCRLYLYAGKTRPVYGRNSVAVVKQEIVIDVFVHTSYNVDSRMDEIHDRLNCLMIDNGEIGMGKVDLYTAYEMNAPKEYTGYRLIYTTMRSKR